MFTTWNYVELIHGKIAYLHARLNDISQKQLKVIQYFVSLLALGCEFLCIEYFIESERMTYEWWMLIEIQILGQSYK
ncbi:hypothetical protein Bhyg_07331 [Pseudolycoriella hygida]|uniref:Uncharacterized protein n=1 Tax=Pseudolycoriella hygida TaxID=35572 RepID=A0A9Q0N2I5_9DIPT|nr:hypothetical protein Bhyg_07331 [Pseudolycoriella hygida]